MRKILMLLPLLAALNAWAGDSDAERVAAAKRYLEVAQMGKLMDDAVAAMSQQVPPGQRQQFADFMRGAIRLDVLERAALDSMVKVFTVEEMNALADFYGSPIGRSAMGKFGIYMADVMPAIQQEMFRALQSLPAQKQ